MGISDTLDLTTFQIKTTRSLLKQYLPGVEVWAYGSRVKWTSRPESDLDVVAFADSNQKAQVFEGIVFGSINKKDFQQIKCLTPQNEIIDKFEQIAYPLDEEISNNDKESHTLTKIRDFLLPRLISGELQIKDAEKTVTLARR